MKNDRRNFLRTAGAALVAASVPLAITAQKDGDRPSPTNNLKQMIILGGVGETSPDLEGPFGEACFQFQMRAVFDAGGHALLSDPVFPDLVNSHIQIQSGGRTDVNDIYIFRGTVARSLNPDLVGKQVTIKIQTIDANNNCNVSLTIADTPVQGLLLPAVQQIRVPLYS